MVDACRGVEHQAQLGEQQDPNGCAVHVDELKQCRTGGHAGGSDARDGQSQRHPYIYFTHQGGEGTAQRSLLSANDFLKFLYFHVFWVL